MAPRTRGEKLGESNVNVTSGIDIEQIPTTRALDGIFTGFWEVLSIGLRRVLLVYILVAGGECVEDSWFRARNGIHPSSLNSFDPSENALKQRR